MATNGIELARAQDLPTKNSELENDSNYANQSEIPSVPTNNSELSNGAGYITSSDIPSIPSNVSDLNNDKNYITNSYDNTSSGLTATDIQSAIDELKTMIDDMKSSSGGGA